MKKVMWTKFEEHVWKGVWLRRFPPSKGWDSKWSKALSKGYRVDFAAWKGNQRAVGDAKDKGFVTYDDVEKLIEDAGVFKAGRLLLVVASDTEIPDGVRAYADDNAVEIVRTRWRA